jgi:protein-disulfide isomerase
MGAEQEIIANHVLTGQVKYVFWPMLDLGPNSENAAVAAFCAGEQDPALFWEFHDTLFRNQRDVFLAGRDYFVLTAGALGVDGPAFESCYDGAEMRSLVNGLDAARREAGVRQRPTFEINGERLAGSQPYATFASVIEGKLP